MVNHEFGPRLRRLRQERGLLQRDVEEALSLRPGAGSQYERGLREPGFALLLTVADYFDVSVDYLLGRPQALKESPALTLGRRQLHQLLRSRPQPAGEPAEKLRALVALAREAAPGHFTQARLARSLGVTERALAGRAGEPQELLRRLSAYLDVNLTG